MKIEKGKIIKVCIKFIIILCITYNIMFFITTTISQKEYFSLFGITFLSMNSDLMESDISENDLVIVKNVNKNDLQKGDIVAYTVNGKIRINKIINEKNGEYVTMSNKNYYPDVELLDYNSIIGKNIAKIPLYGYVIKFLQSKITSVIIFMFLILVFFYNNYMNKKKKQRVRKLKILNWDRVSFLNFKLGPGLFF